MSDKKTLEQSIQEELQRTGYPTEILSASLLQKHGWSVVHNPSYWDNEESQSREFDIRSYMGLHNSAGNLYIGISLIIECKKSEKPWVFFTTEEKHGGSRLGLTIKVITAGKPLFTNFSHQDSIISDDELRAFHHYFQKPRIARTFYEPLKHQENASHSQTIYTAVMATVKATLFHISESPFENLIHIFYPVIIFNGDLFEAFVKPDKTIELTPTPNVQLAFNYIQQKPSQTSSIWSVQQRYIIDVVHENYLDQYLTIIEKELQTIASRI